MQIRTLELLPKETRVCSEEIQQLLRNIPTGKLAYKLGVAESTTRNYKAGLHRINLEQLEKLNFSGKFKIGLEKSNKFFEFPEEIKLDKNLLWLIGFWRGDSDNSERRIGVCNIEESIARKSFEVFANLIGQEHVSFEAELPQNFKGKIICNKTRIRKQRKHVCYTIRVYSTLFKSLFLNLVSKIEKNLYEFPNELQLAYVSGFIDAEASVHKKKGIRIYQKYSKNGEGILMRVKKLLTQNNLKVSKIRHEHDDLCLTLNLGKDNENLRKFINVSYLHSERKLEKVSVLLFPHSRP